MGRVGWKLNLLARRAQPGQDFDGIARSLGFETPAGEVMTLDRALYPAPGLALGQWNDHLLLLSDSLAVPLLSSAAPNAAGLKTLDILGPHRLLVATLHSVTNFYGFALFEQGKLVRGRVGAADDGLIWEHGPRLDWEGEAQEEEFDGEQAVFTFLSEVFGSPLDTAAAGLFALELRRYRAASLQSRLKRLFGF